MKKHWIVLPSIFAEFQPWRLVQVTVIDNGPAVTDPRCVEVEYLSRQYPDLPEGKPEKDYVPKERFAPTAIEAIDKYLKIWLIPRIEWIKTQNDPHGALAKHYKECTDWQWFQAIIKSHLAAEKIDPLPK